MKENHKYVTVLNEYSTQIDVKEIDKDISKINVTENNNKEVWKILYSCLDLTSLNTTDTRESIYQFIDNEVNKKEDIEELPSIAAICVYPSMIAAVKDALTSDINIATVTGGFPHSQTFEEIKIAETSLAVSYGANEIDTVMDLGKFYDESYEELAEELQEIKFATRDSKLKVILETGALKCLQDVYKTTILAVYSGADFVKTSTGKVYPGANPHSVYTICLALRDYYKKTGTRVGIKISGGVSSVEDAVTYYSIVKHLLGSEYTNNKLFRIGTSSLITKLEEKILSA